MKKHLSSVVAVLLLITNYALSQSDWTTNTLDLHYWNGTEKIDIQAYTTSAAIYFSSVPSNRELRALRRDFPDFELNAAKK